MRFIIIGCIGISIFLYLLILGSTKNKDWELYDEEQTQALKEIQASKKKG